MMQRDVACKSRCPHRAGVERPANAAIGFSGVAKLEKTRLNQTTSGFSLRMVFSRRTGLDMLPNFQHRITLKPGSSGCWSAFNRRSIRIGREFVVVQLVGKDGQLDVGIALQLPRDVEGVLVQLPPARRKGRN